MTDESSASRPGSSFTIAKALKLHSNVTVIERKISSLSISSSSSSKDVDDEEKVGYSYSHSPVDTENAFAFIDVLCTNSAYKQLRLSVSLLADHLLGECALENSKERAGFATATNATSSHAWPLTKMELNVKLAHAVSSAFTSNKASSATDLERKLAQLACVALYSKRVNEDGIECGTRVAQAWVPLKLLYGAATRTGVPFLRVVELKDAENSTAGLLVLSNCKAVKPDTLAASVRRPVTDAENAPSLVIRSVGIDPTHSACHLEPLRFVSPLRNQDDPRAKNSFLPPSCNIVQCMTRAYSTYSGVNKALPTHLWTCMTRGSATGESTGSRAFITDEWFDYAYELSKFRLHRNCTIQELLQEVVAFKSREQPYLADAVYKSPSQREVKTDRTDEPVCYDQFVCTDIFAEHPSGDCEDATTDFALTFAEIASGKRSKSKFESVRKLHSEATHYCFVTIECTINSSNGAASGKGGGGGVSTDSKTRDASYYEGDCKSQSLHVCGALVPWFVIYAMLVKWVKTFQMSRLKHATPSELREYELIKAWVENKSTIERAAASKKPINDKNDLRRYMHIESTEQHRNTVGSDGEDMVLSMFELFTLPENASLFSMIAEGTSTSIDKAKSPDPRLLQALYKTRYHKSESAFDRKSFYRNIITWHSLQLMEEIGIPSFGLGTIFTDGQTWSKYMPTATQPFFSRGSSNNGLGYVAIQDRRQHEVHLHAPTKKEFECTPTVYGVADSIYMNRLLALSGISSEQNDYYNNIDIFLAPASVDSIYSSIANDMHNNKKKPEECTVQKCIEVARLAGKCMYFCLPKVYQRHAPSNDRRVAEMLKFIKTSSVADSVRSGGVVFSAPSNALSETDMKLLASHFSSQQYKLVKMEDVFVSPTTLSTWLLVIPST